MADEVPGSYSLLIGGPFWRLQKRLGLLGPDRLPTVKTAVLFAAVAWLPPALLALLQGVALSETLGGRAFLHDFGAYARFIIAIMMFVVTERFADNRDAALLRQVNDAGLVPPEEQAGFTALLQRADQRTNSARGEALMLCVSYAVSVASLFLQVTELRDSWIGTLVDGRIRISSAGWWALLVSMPLFWFLALRWLWRFVVLTLLLLDMARLRLRLAATHPDRSGGIGFLGQYPTLFVGVAFALSCVAASAALREILFAGQDLLSIVAPFLLWVALVLIILVGPLTVFVPALLRLKRHALLEYGAFAFEHNRSFETKWIRREPDGRDALGTPDISSLSDLTAVVQSIRAMRVFPVGTETLVPLLIATALPWLAVVATSVPLAELLKTVVKALL
jgi:hypothetical protein